MALPRPPAFPTCVYPRVGTPFLVTNAADFSALDPAEVADHPNHWLTPTPPTPVETPEATPSLDEETPVKRGPGRPRTVR